MNTISENVSIEEIKHLMKEQRPVLLSEDDRRDLNKMSLLAIVAIGVYVVMAIICMLTAFSIEVLVLLGFFGVVWVGAVLVLEGRDRRKRNKYTELYVIKVYAKILTFSRYHVYLDVLYYNFLMDMFLTMNVKATRIDAGIPFSFSVMGKSCVLELLVGRKGKNLEYINVKPLKK